MRRVFVLLTVATTMAAMIAASVPATAVPPEQEQFPFTVGFVDEDLCGFPIEFSFEGTVNVTRFFDRQGNLTRIQMRSADDAIATNLNNGKTATGHEVSTITVDVEEGTEALTGLSIHLNVPGHGAVLMEVGRVAFDLETGEPTFVAGQHQLAEGDFSEFCAALA